MCCLFFVVLHDAFYFVLFSWFCFVLFCFVFLFFFFFVLCFVLFCFVFYIAHTLFQCKIVIYILLLFYPVYSDPNEKWEIVKIIIFGLKCSKCPLKTMFRK